MKILLTNDDAYFAKGLTLLFKQLKKKWDTLIVAPEYEQSASSHSITLNRPLRIREVEKNVISVDGTPVDCVLVAIHKIIGTKPNLIISGINRGPNLGDDVLYSGTVAAAREGALMEIPSLAVSLTSWTNCHFDYAVEFVDSIVEKIMVTGMQPGVLYNINIPNVPPNDIRGIAETKLAKRVYTNVIDERKDPRGGTYYWIGGKALWEKNESSDYQAIKDKKVSITPLGVKTAKEYSCKELETLLN